MGKTNSAANAKLQYEAGQEYNAMAAMTDSGIQEFYLGISLVPAKRDEPESADGLATGGEVTPGSTNNNVSVAALTCFLAGVLTTVSADSDVAITRPTSTHNISSVTINSSGVIAVVAGTDGTAFSATRGAAGGPPLIPVGSIEIALSTLFRDLRLPPRRSSRLLARPGTVGHPVWNEDPFWRDHLRLGASCKPHGKHCQGHLCPGV